jgi:hypothetical protein
MKGLNMRKGRRFTPRLLERWEKEGRGTGSGADYQPWHQVTRSDPSSRGRSHLVYVNSGRLAHLLSDAEYVAFAFATMCVDVVEVREQFQLPATSGRYGGPSGSTDGWVEGTEAIAQSFGLRHPIVRQDGATRAWSLTSDLVLILRSSHPDPGLVVSAKYDEELKQPRTMELLRMEREFWRRQGVPWLLLTPQLYDQSSQGVLRAGLPYVVGQPPVPASHIALCRELQPDISGMTMQDICRTVQERLGTPASGALSAFWGSVWAGALTLDLTQAWRSDQRVRFVSACEFTAQNPIASRRSAWCA